MATPIADAFAYNRPVDAEAMLLIRKLETDRAALVNWVRYSTILPQRLIKDVVTKYPLDKV